MFKHTAEDSVLELCQRVKARKKTAIKELYDTYIGYLSAVCSRYIIDPDDVKDILQDSFIKIIYSFDTFEYKGKESLKFWMTRIVVNTALDFIKKKTKFDIIDNNDITDDIEEQIDEDEMERIPINIIHGMIKELPIGYRTVFNLYVFEQKSHKEIADILGIKESSSASQFHRAKKILVNRINEYKISGKEDIHE